METLPALSRPANALAGARLGIDASNLRGGGGATHLLELLRAARPEEAGFSKVVVWSGQSTLRQLPERPWLQPVHVEVLDRSLGFRLWWQNVRLPALAREACDLLFVPGGNFRGRFRPVVTMCRNLLPFQVEEMRRFGLSRQHLRLRLLRFGQTATFRDAQGIIFLTEYARAAIQSHAGTLPGRVAVIPHGIDPRFRFHPRPQKPIESYSRDRPFRLLYVSIVDLYKHQWVVAESVARLRAMDLPVALDLVGPAYGPALKRLRRFLKRWDPQGEFVNYQGQIAHSELHSIYRQADAFVFASSCENLPNILLEAMAAGLPIASSDRGPMPEILAHAGVYFDPENAEQMTQVLRDFLRSPDVRQRCASAACESSLQYSWERCAQETFAFLAEVLQSCAGS